MADTHNETPAQDALTGSRIAPGAVGDSQALTRIAVALEGIQALLERVVAASEEEQQFARLLTEAMNEAPQASAPPDLPILNDNEAEDAPPVRLDDLALVDAHYRNRDGTYGINDPYTGKQRATIADEAARLDRLVGRGRAR